MGNCASQPATVEPEEGRVVVGLNGEGRSLAEQYIGDRPALPFWWLLWALRWYRAPAAARWRHTSPLRHGLCNADTPPSVGLCAATRDQEVSAPYLSHYSRVAGSRARNAAGARKLSGYPKG